MTFAVYSALHYLAMPYVLARLWLRGMRNPAYRRRLGERFGFGAHLADTRPVVWVHAVSVGEVQAALPLIKAVVAGPRRVSLLVTTTTPTGAQRVVQALGGQVQHRYMPYDLPGCIGRFLDRTRPHLAVVFETEVWPNMLRQCDHRDIPVILANARLSHSSAAGYQRLGRFAPDVFSLLSRVAAQSQDDADRIIQLGVRPESVEVTGSVKFDVRISASVVEQAQVMRRCWGVDRSVWIAASTHEGEEELVLATFAQLLRIHPDLMLALVPRHPDRAQRVAALARKRGFHTVFRSDAPVDCAGVDVFVGDTLGELPVMYGAADVAFVGGSLVPIGGHNILEPAALGVPVVIGPHLHNFAEISRRLLQRGAARGVKSERELADTVAEFLDDADLRHKTGECGRRFVENNRGALQSLMRIVEPYLGTG